MRLFAAPLLVCALAAVPAAQSDVIAKLGSNTTEAHDAIFSAFASGFVDIVGARDVFKTASPETRAAMTTAVIGVARAYTGTADFAKRYAMYREQQKPQPSSDGPTSADALNEQMRKSLEQGIAGMEKAAQEMPQMKKEFDAQIAVLRKQLAAVGQDADANANMDKALKQAAVESAQAHQQALARWEQRYPVNPKPFIAQRLHDFLALSETVDFTATVSKRNGQGNLKFDNPAYESKNSQWKYLYRAGKPAVNAARAAAQDWLKAIGG